MAILSFMKAHPLWAPLFIHYNCGQIFIHSILLLKGYLFVTQSYIPCMNVGMDLWFFINRRSLFSCCFNKLLSTWYQRRFLVHYFLNRRKFRFLKNECFVFSTKPFFNCYSSCVTFFNKIYKLPLLRTISLDFSSKKKRSRKLGAHVMLDIMRDIKDTNDFKHTKAIQNNPISQTKICQEILTLACQRLTKQRRMLIMKCSHSK